jgi:hypothetical protein
MIQHRRLTQTFYSEWSAERSAAEGFSSPFLLAGSGKQRQREASQLSKDPFPLEDRGR